VKNKKAFILYKYNTFNNDFEYITEYYNLKELKEKEKNTLHLNEKTNIQKYIAKSIENIKEKINGRYIIIKEELAD